jgi:RNA polymerase sigma factor (sigma-70 family)
MPYFHRNGEGSRIQVDINTLHKSVASGDGASEEQLFQHLHVSFRLLAQHRVWNEEDSEEVVQDALMTISAKYKDIVFETSFAAWAYKVLNNKILDYVKAKKVKQGAMEKISEQSSTATPPNPDPELKSRLLSCLKRLCRANSRHARVLNLHYHGYGTGEICEKLELKPNNFYVMLSRARSMLEHCLEKGDIK